MKALYCVDYLAHSWDAGDLVCSYSEVRKKLYDLSHKVFLEDVPCDHHHRIARSRRRHSSSSSSNRNKEHNTTLVEEYRLKRLENALWRSMARHCTPNLGRSNPLVRPESVNWQKGTDITWLYGPFHPFELKSPEAPISSLCNTPTELTPASSPVSEIPAPNFLKPVLKKREPAHDVNDLLNSAWGLDPAIISNAARYSEPIAYHGRRRTTWPGTPFGGKALRFNPNIMCVEYTPSAPVVRLAIPGKDENHERKQRHQRKQPSSPSSSLSSSSSPSPSPSPSSSSSSSSSSSPPPPTPQQQQQQQQLSSSRVRSVDGSAWLPPSPPPSPPPKYYDDDGGPCLELEPLLTDVNDDYGGDYSDSYNDDDDDDDDDDNDEDDDYFYFDDEDDDTEIFGESGQSVLALTHQVASNVKDIAVLCGAIVVYKGISMTVQPFAWMAERLVGRD